MRMRSVRSSFGTTSSKAYTIPVDQYYPSRTSQAPCRTYTFGSLDERQELVYPCDIRARARGHVCDAELNPRLLQIGLRLGRAREIHLDDGIGSFGLRTGGSAVCLGGKLVVSLTGLLASVRRRRS